MNNPGNPNALIREFLDGYFEARQQEGPYAMAHLAKLIPRSMLDRDQPLKGDKEYARWRPIPGTFSDKELAALESLYKHPLPPSYRYFLQQLHFITLYTDQNNLRFFPSFPRQLASGFRDILEKYYPGLTRRGFLPFANYGDWGVACFSTHAQARGNEYPVVILDHENGYIGAMPYTATFMEIFQREKGGWVWLGVQGWNRREDLRRH